MIYLVTNNIELFESEDYKVIPLSTAVNIINNWDQFQFDTETGGHLIFLNKPTINFIISYKNRIITLKLKLNNYMSSDLKKCGVYSITNLVDKKMYIGSTSVSFLKRWQHHRKFLRKGIHHSIYLQHAYNKYGASNFEYKIIEITEPQHSKIREGYYISLYNTLNPKYGYNTEIITEFGILKCSESTKKKLKEICKLLWKDGIHSNSILFLKGDTPWNKDKKCDNISLTRRCMFSSVEIYKENVLIATFRSVIDLDEWTVTNTLPGLEFYSKKSKRQNKGKFSTHLLSSNIQRAIRNNKIYRGLLFKRGRPLSPEMGIVKWENCGNGEIPNPQPSQELTVLEGSETNS